MNELINSNYLDKLINSALEEDISTGDITTNNLIPDNLNAKAYLKSKEDGIIAGLPLIELILKKLDNNVKVELLIEENSKIKKGDIIANIYGKYRAILTGERLLLNFIQRISGIATETNKYVEAVKDYPTKILDTRKTVPGLRLIDKYAVKSGGATNHRIGLYDMVMIKDNHIDVAGSITNAVNNIRPNIKPEIKIEVETRNLEEVKEALENKVDIIMLDNMNNETMKKAVDLIKKNALTEASGNMTLERVREVAALGVDFISVGALTHSVKALDIGLYIEHQNY